MAENGTTLPLRLAYHLERLTHRLSLIDVALVDGTIDEVVNSLLAYAKEELIFAEALQEEGDLHQMEMALEGLAAVRQLLCKLHKVMEKRYEEDEFSSAGDTGFDDAMGVWKRGNAC